MEKFKQLYCRPDDLFPWLGNRDCIEKSAINVLKTRYYNRPELLDLFLEDTSFGYCRRKKLENYVEYEKVYRLREIRNFQDKEKETDRLKRILDRYGEVVAVISVKHLPYWFHYDEDIMNIVSEKHAVAVIGYDEEGFLILEDAKYIGAEYEMSNINPTIGRCRFEYMDLCMKEFFQCFDVEFHPDADKETIKKYVENVQDSIIEHADSCEDNILFGQQALCALRDDFLGGCDMNELYTEENLVEIGKLASSREVLKHFLIREMNDNGEIAALFEADIKMWNKVLRVLMRRKANDRGRVYDNTDLCEILECLCDMEKSIGEYVTLNRMNK